MWKHKSDFNGLSVLPYDGGTYTQAPFEPIDEETFRKMYAALKEVQLINIVESDDNTDLSSELACSGGSCDIINM